MYNACIYLYNYEAHKINLIVYKSFYLRYMYALSGDSTAEMPQGIERHTSANWQSDSLSVNRLRLRLLSNDETSLCTITKLSSWSFTTIILIQFHFG